MPETTYTIDRRTYEALFLLRTLIENEKYMTEANNLLARDGLADALAGIKAEIERIIGFSLDDFRHMQRQDEQWRPDGPKYAVIVDPADWNTEANRRARLLGNPPLPVPKTAYELALEVEQLKNQASAMTARAEATEAAVNSMRQERDGAVLVIQISGYGTKHATDLIEAHDAAIREPLEAQVAAMQEVIQKSKEEWAFISAHGHGGYDWNADPLYLTRTEGEINERITAAIAQASAIASRYRARVRAEVLREAGDKLRLTAAECGEDGCHEANLAPGLREAADFVIDMADAAEREAQV